MNMQWLVESWKLRRLAGSGWFAVRNYVGGSAPSIKCVLVCVVCRRCLAVGRRREEFCGGVDGQKPVDRD